MAIKNEAMNKLINYIKNQFHVTDDELSQLQEYFTTENIPAKTKILEAGNIERYIYFLDSGIVKGYQNIDGKFVIQHLVSENNFFTSLESFMSETISADNFETVTDCQVVKIAKSDFDYLQANTTFWGEFVKTVTNEHLKCKSERVQDFQVLTAKERYLKFITQHPSLALNVSIENIASFLGMEPQSLSRIRKQVTI